MAVETIEDLRWRELNRTIALVEEQNRRLRRRGLVAFGLNTLLLVGLIGWLLWPGKSLTAAQVTATGVTAERMQTPGSALDRDGLHVMDVDSDTRITLGANEPGGAALTMQSGRTGQIVARVDAAPFVGLYAETTDGDPATRQPQIELSLAGPDRSPRIVLRDLDGRVTWQAP